MVSALSRPVPLLAALLVLAGCQVAPVPPSPSPSEPAPATGNPGPIRPIAWEGARDCTRKLQLLDRAARDGLLPDDPAAVPIAVRVVLPRAEWGRPEPKDGWVQADLPLRVVDGTTPLAPGVACWIEVGPPRDVQGETREIGREQVRSAYQTSSRREPNPAYEVAEIRLRQAERAAKESGGIMTVGDPLLDLVGTLVEGVAGAFNERSRSAELEDAIATLAATQRSIEHPVWRHYHFERAVVQGRRHALLPIALVGPAARERSTLIRQREVRTFHVLDGLDPRDREYEAHDAASVSPLELERWSRQPPVVPVSALVRALLEPASSPPHAAPPWPADKELDDPGLIASLEPEAVRTPPRPRGGNDRPPGRPSGATGSRTAAKAASRPAALAPVPALRSHPPLAPDPAAPGATASDKRPELAVVRGEGRGVGVYLSPHTVITPARLIGDAKVLDAEVRGDLVPALVAARDPALDLALLKLPRAGYPARVDPDVGAGGILRVQTSARARDEAHVVGVANGSRTLHLKLAAGTAPAIGTPLFEGDRLAGLVVAVEGEDARAVSATAIRSLLQQLPDSDLLLD